MAEKKISWKGTMTELQSEFKKYFRMQYEGKSVLTLAREQYLHKKEEYGIGYQDLNFVICQKDGSPMTPDAMTRKWKRFIHANNLPVIRLHVLRHSNATALIQAGVNPRVVQQRLGHADVSITLNTYTHVCLSAFWSA